MRQMCHTRVSDLRRADSNIKVLNDDNIDNALDPSTSLPAARGRDDVPDTKGEEHKKTHLGGGSLGPGSGRSPVSEEGGGN